MTSNKLMASPPVLDKVLVTDVTSRSFSLIYSSNESGSPIVEIYSDAAELNKISNHKVVAYPIATGNVFSGAQDQFTAKKIIVDAAKALGIVKLAVTGLSPDTQYYVKYGLDNTAMTESTLCPDAGVSFCLDLSTSLISVKTAKQQTRSQLTLISETLFTNDVLIIINKNIAVGELIIMATENTRYPVSVFAGDGMPLPYVLVDMNNYTIYDQQSTYIIRGDDEQAKGNHGESIVIRQYRGQGADSTQVGMVGKVGKVGGLVKSVDRKMADCNADGNVNGYDSLLLQHVITTNIPSTDYTDIAFHPFLCNLYMEEGLNSVVSAVNIDASDLTRLSNALVGKTRLEDLPEAP